LLLVLVAIIQTVVTVVQVLSIVLQRLRVEQKAVAV